MKTRWHTQLRKAVIGAVIMGGVMGIPEVAGAAATTAITPAKGFTKTTVTQQGSVYTVSTSEIVGNGTTAVNVFDHYALAKDNIANMNFGNNAAGTANNLVNFVRDKIDIDGTVNAVRANKIGGHMYFLSSDGIAVGQSGVINAGSLTLMTPSPAVMRKFAGEAGVDVDEEALQSELTGGTYGTALLDDAKRGTIPLNSDATITVDGRLYTTGNMDIRSGSVSLGSTTNSAALLKSGVVDFTDLVNVKGDSSVLTNAGLGTGLTATADGDTGDITLAAAATAANGTDSEFWNRIGDTVKHLFTKETTKAEINQYGTIDASRYVAMTAHAENTIDGANNRLDNAVANVNINGSVTGKNIQAKAEVLNQFEDTDASEDRYKEIGFKALGTVTDMNLDADWSVLESKAAVTVGENAVLTATQAAGHKDSDNVDLAALDISAVSNMSMDIGSTGAPFTLEQARSDSFTMFIPPTAVTFGQATNNATVTIDGTLNSAGDTNLKAYAKLSAGVGAEMATTRLNAKPEYLDAAVSIAVLGNQANVTISDKAKLDGDGSSQHLKGSLTVDATAKTGIDTEASADVPENDMASGAVNVTYLTTGAAIKAGSSIRAGSIDMETLNDITANNVTSSVTNSGSDVRLIDYFIDSKTFKNMLSKIQLKAGGSHSLFNMEDYTKDFTIGAAVAVAYETNTSTIDVAKGVGLTGANSNGTAGDVTLQARMVTDDVKMAAKGSMKVSDDTASSKKADVSAGVLVADISNSSTVAIADGTDTARSLISGNNVTIKADTEMLYNRPQKQVAALKAAWKALIDKFSSSSDPDYQKVVADANKWLAVFEGTNWDGQNFGENFSDVISRSYDFIEASDLLCTDAVKAGVSILESPLKVLDQTWKFANAPTYANFSAASTAASGGKANSDKIDVAGSVSVVILNNASHTDIGTYAAVNAVNKADVGSATKAQTVAFTGNTGTLFMPVASAENGAGVSVAVHDIDSTSDVTVGDDASLKGGAVAVQADNNAVETGVVFGNATAGTTAIDGMVNVMNGTSSAAVTIGDGVAVTAVNSAAAASEVKAGINDGSLTIGAANHTVLTGISGALTSGSSGSIGVGVAVFDYDLGSTVTMGTDDGKKRGAMTAHSVTIDATNDGTVNSVAIAGSVTKANASGEKNDGVFGTLSSWIKSGKKYTNFGLLDKLDDKLVKESDPALKDAAGADQNQGDNKGDPSIMGKNEMSSVSGSHLAIAGSVALNILNNTTKTQLNHVDVTVLPDLYDKTYGKVGVSAADDIFTGAWAGAAAINWINGKQTVPKAGEAAAPPNKNVGTTVGISGAFAMNDISTDTVVSSLTDSSVRNAAALTNQATKEGAVVAAGLGVAMSHINNEGGDSGNAIYIAGSGSINTADVVVKAELDHTDVHADAGKTDVTNKAYDSDIQVTGGVNAAIAKGGGTAVGVGLSIVSSNITNDVESIISGGTYDHIGTVDMASTLAAKQISAGVGVAWAEADPSLDKEKMKGYTFEGVAVANKLTNTVKTTIQDAAITADTVKMGTGDAASDSSNPFMVYLQNRGLDPAGSSYTDSLANDTVYNTETADQDYNSKLKAATAKAGESGGNLMITGGLSVAWSQGDQGKAAASAAVSVNELTNTYGTTISGAVIQAGSITAGTDQDTVIVGVAAGGAGSNKFGGAGSVSWLDTNNTATTTVENSALTMNSGTFTSDNKTTSVNVAGQFSKGKVGAGLAVAYDNMDNTTGAYIKGSQISALQPAGVDLDVTAKNNGTYVSVAAGVTAVTGTVGVNGAFAINSGADNTEASIDNYIWDSSSKRSTINAAKAITVDAENWTRFVTIAGGVTAGSGSAIGGALALNDLGGYSSEGSKSSDIVKAHIDHTDITSATGDTIDVSALDDSHIVTVGAALGANKGTVTIEGSVATSLVNKNVLSGLTDTNIDMALGNNYQADLTVKADNHTVIDDWALVGAITIGVGKVIQKDGASPSSEGAAVGMGVGVNRIVQTTEAVVDGGTQNLAYGRVSATADPHILAIGIGGAIMNTVGIAGSAGVNIIDNSAVAKLNQVTMDVQGNLGVVAQDDDVIENLVGDISVSKDVAIGASVAVNTISGDTSADVNNSTVHAGGSQTKTIMTKSTVDDTAIVDDLASGRYFLGQPTLVADRTDTSSSGLVVDSSATHTLRSIVANIAASGKGSVAGNVNVSTLGGSTSAAVTDSTVNKDAASAAGGAGAYENVLVRAADYANATGLTGSAAGAANVGVGAAVDVNKITRNTSAVVEHTGTAAKSYVGANTFSVTAESKHGISSLATGDAGVIEGAGLGGGISVAKLSGSTKAAVRNIVSDAHSVAVDANHLARINNGNIGAGLSFYAGAGVGIAAGSVTDTWDTQAVLDGSKVTADGDVAIQSANQTRLKEAFGSGGAECVYGAGVAFAISVNNLEDTVHTDIKNSTVKGKSVTAKAVQAITAKADDGVGSLGIIGGGVGVGINIMNLNSSVGMTVENSALVAANGNLSLLSQETRDVTLTSGNAAAGAGAFGWNEIQVNIGSAVTDADVQDAITALNDKAEGSSFNKFLTNGVTPAEKDSFMLAAAPDAGFGTGLSAIGTTISNSTLAASGTVTVASQAQTAIDMHSGSGAAGAIAVNGNRNIVKVHSTVATSVADSAVSGDAIDIKAENGNRDSKGIYMLSWDGAYAVAGGFGADGQLTLDTDILTDIKKSNLTAKGNLSVTAKDTATAKVKSSGVPVGAVTSGAILASLDNHNQVGVNLNAAGTMSFLQAGNAITVSADREGSQEAETTGTIIGVALDVNGSVATVTDTSDVTAKLVGGDYTLTAPVIEIKAGNVPQLTASASPGSGGLVDGHGIHAATNETASSTLSIDSGNLFESDAISLGAVFGDGINTTAHAVGVGGQISGVGVASNHTDAASKVTVTTTVGSEDYIDSSGGHTSRLTIYGRDQTIQNAEMTNLNVGVAVAIGYGTTTNTSENNVNVSAGGGHVGMLTVQANDANQVARYITYSKGTGGGLIDITPLAAKSFNSLQNNAAVNLSGTWNVDGAAVLSSIQNDVSSITADVYHITGIGVAGLSVTNDIGGTTALNLTDGTVVNAASLVGTARSKERTEAYLSGYVVNVLAGGAGYDSGSTVDKKSAIGIGKNAAVTTTAGQTWLTGLDGLFYNQNSAENDGALLEVPVARSNRSITTNNKISLGTGALLKSTAYSDDADITLNAADTINVQSQTDSIGKTANVGAVASETSTLSRTNIITVDGTIDSAHDVNLYAGALAGYTTTELLMDVQANANALALFIQVADASMTAAFTEKMQVEVTPSSVVSAAQQVNLTADSGSTKIKAQANEYHMWAKDHTPDNLVVDTSTGEEAYNRDMKNFVRVDGSVNAGTQNIIDATLSGTLIPDGYSLDGSGTAGLVVTTDDTALKETIKTGTVDYGKLLWERMLAAQTKRDEYKAKIDAGTATDADKAAYAAYLQLRQQLWDKLSLLDLIVATTVQETTTYNYKSKPVVVVDIPDLAASGGSVSVNSRNLTGTGSIAANGHPEISLTNNTNGYLKLHNATIGEIGGDLKLRGTSVDTNSSINALNQDDDYKSGAAFANLHTDSGTSTVPAITVTSKNTTGDVKVIAAATGSKEVYSGLPTVELSGLVKNSSGLVNVTNKSGDIDLTSSETGVASGIYAKEIHLTATGAINQGYTAGMTNIGGNPENQYASYAALAEADLNGQLKGDYFVDHSYAYSLPAIIPVQSSGAWIAGGSVYLNGEYINVNGTIQSGYNKYYADIASTALDDLSVYKNDAAKQATLNGETVYKLNDGDRAVRQSDGTYAYEVQVYYNPSTKKVIVDDIDTSGGKIYLTGKISSTGNGKIQAVDGGATIAVANNTAADTQFGKVIDNNNEGVISITDLNKDTQTVYRRNSTTLISHITDPAQSTTTKGPASDSYATKSGLRYTWTHTTQEVENKAYRYEQYLDAFKVLKERTILQSDTFNEHDKGVTTPVAVASADTNGFNATLVNKLGDKDSKTAVFKGYIIDRGVQLNWETYILLSDSTQQYTYSLPASKAIGIQFLGNTDGTIDLTGGGNVGLNGNIQANSAGAALAVTAKTGAIAQTAGTTIKSDHINLAAATGISGISVISLPTVQGGDVSDTVSLKAVTASGNIDVDVAAGLYHGWVLDGNVALDGLTTGQGTVKLRADGNITQSGTGLSVQGDVIDLASDGYMGTAAQALVIKGGQQATNGVNAKAEGSIYLTQDSGDMRVGTIASANGDVALTAQSGHIVSGTPIGMTVQDNPDTILQHWRDVGVISGDGDYTDRIASDNALYKASIEKGFANYLVMKAYYGDDTSLPAYKALYDIFNGYSSADDYMARSSSYKKITAPPVYYWTANQMLYTIQDSVINNTAGSTDDADLAANIIGRNITLNAKGIGEDSGTKETISLVGIARDDRLADLKKLSAANPNDVTWDTENMVATIGGKRALGVNGSGIIKVTATDDVYLAGRPTDPATGENALPMQISTVTTAGNIRILGQSGVFNALTDAGVANFTGHDLTLEGGSGDVGAADKYITVDLEGDLTARSEGNIYIEGLAKALNLDMLYAGKTMSIDDAAGIFMSTTASKVSYVNAGELNLTSKGAIGAQDNPIRVKDNGNIVNASGTSVYLAGKEAGTLLLGTVQATNGPVDVSSNGTLSVGREAVLDSKGNVTAPAVDGKVTATADSALSGKEGVILRGLVGVGSHTLALQSANGAVTQLLPADTAKGITAGTLSVTTNLGQALEGLGNKIDHFSTMGMKNNTINGDVLFKASAPDGLLVDFNKSSIDGNVAITNLAPVGTVTIGSGATVLHEGDFSVQAAGTITNADDLLVGGSIELQSTAGSVYNTGALTGGKAVTMTAHTDIGNSGAVTGTKGSVTMTADLGSITNSKSVTAGTRASMTAGAGIANSDTVTAGTDANMQARTTLTNSGAVTAGADAVLQAGTGMTNDGAITAGGKANLTTAAGDIVNKAAVTANGTDVVMTAATGGIDNGAAVKAQRNVIMTAAALLRNTGAVTGVTGDVELTSATDAIDNKGDVAADQDVTMTAHTDIGNSGAVTGTKGSVTMTADLGSITNSKSVTAGTRASMTAGAGIANSDTVTAGTDANMQARTTLTNSGAVTAGADAVLQAGTGMTNDGAITAGGKANLTTAAGDIVNKAAVTANGTDVVMTAATGGIDNGAAVKAQRNVIMTAAALLRNTGAVTGVTGDVELTSATDAIDNKGDVAADQDVTMTAHTDIGNSGAVTGTKGSVTMTADLGSITNSKNVTAGTSSAMNAGTGITNNGSVTTDGDAVMQAGTGIANGGAVTAGGKAGLTTAAGNIVNDGKVDAGTDANLQTNMGNIIDKGTLTGGNNVTAVTKNGKVQVLQDVTATAGNVLLKAETGRVEVGSASGDAVVTAGNRASLVTDSTTKSDIEIYGDIAGANGIDLRTNVGDIIWHGRGTSAQGDTQIVTQTGDINLGGDVKANGDNIIHAGTGNITAAYGSTIESLNGNAEVSSGKGDINLYTLKAKQEAGADVADGNIKIFWIEGEAVLLAVRNPGKTMEIEHLVPGSKLSLTGDAINITELVQRQGSTNMLTLSPRGTDSTKPMKYLNIGNVVTQNGLHIDQLWSRNSRIHVSAPKFYIDKLGITDAAYLSNSDTTTTVWGRAPERDGSNVSYWYNPQNHNPWMNLYFTDTRHKQFSNGILLRNDDYYYPYEQRFSGVNIGLKRTDRSEHAYEQVADYKVSAQPGFYYGMYDRYGLIEDDMMQWP